MPMTISEFVTEAVSVSATVPADVRVPAPVTVPEGESAIAAVAGRIPEPSEPSTPTEAPEPERKPKAVPVAEERTRRTGVDHRGAQVEAEEAGPRRRLTKKRKKAGGRGGHGLWRDMKRRKTRANKGSDRQGRREDHSDTDRTADLPTDSTHTRYPIPRLTHPCTTLSTCAQHTHDCPTCTHHCRQDPVLPHTHVPTCKEGQENRRR